MRYMRYMHTVVTSSSDLSMYIHTLIIIHSVYVYKYIYMHIHTPILSHICTSTTGENILRV